MRIAIMTWFHYRNYGTALQVSALSKFLTQRGHEVNVINYLPQRPGKTLPDYSVNAVLKRIGNRFYHQKPEERKYAPHFCNDNKEFLFLKYLSGNINLTEKCQTLSELENLNKYYDAFICGSDQIWSPNNFDPPFFLNFVSDPQKMIAYAPSVGLPQISDKYVASCMRRLIDQFIYLSVREEQGAELIHSLTGKTATVVCDPTLLLTGKQWDEQCDSRKVSIEAPYLLTYMLGINDKHWKQIARIAEKKELAIKIIPVFDDDTKREGCIAEPIGPEEFVNLISNASYVCTDSFHGMAFAIQFHKQFTIFERFSKDDPINQNSRIMNLLNITNLLERLVGFSEEYTEIHDIDYTSVDEKLDSVREQSKQYLLTSLAEVESCKVFNNKNHILTDHTLCCGCGACANVCPASAVSVALDTDGFLRASVNETVCTDCGKCKSVCPFEGEKAGVKMQNASLYSYKDKDLSVLKVSSSGGFAYRLSELLVDEGYAIAGCTFDENEQKAKHILITKKEELHRLQGSKYMQSDFAPCLEQISQCKQPVAIFGTPCQIAGAKRQLAKRNDILYIDLICHGVPTYHLYEKYRDHLQRTTKIDPKKLKVNYRYKESGWREIYICDRWDAQPVLEPEGGFVFPLF